MGKRKNGEIIYLTDNQLHLQCGKVRLEARAALCCNDAGIYLSGVITRGPENIVGKGVLVGTTNFQCAHISIQK